MYDVLKPSDEDEDAMHLDAPMSDAGSGSGEEGGPDEGEDAGMDVDDAPPVPMPASGGIQALRERLHARMAELRQKNRGGAGEAGSRDELLEERRLQRAAMRERRRKETKEKIRREEERKGKGKDKGKEKEKATPRATPARSVKTQVQVPAQVALEKFARCVYTSYISNRLGLITDIS